MIEYKTQEMQMIPYKDRRKIALFIRDVAEGIWNIAADFKEKHKAEGGDAE